MTPGKNNEEGYIVETVTVGGSMKVTVFDPITLQEASIIAPTGSSQREAQELAVRKLRYLQEKRKEEK
jgi:hypothetical protein